MKLPDSINKKLESLYELCLTHKVTKLYVFGSVSKGNFDPQNSDIDLIVDLEIENPIERGETLISLWNKLEKLFERKVDLLTLKKIKNPFLLKEIKNSKQILYDRAS